MKELRLVITDLTKRADESGRELVLQFQEHDQMLYQIFLVPEGGEDAGIHACSFSVDDDRLSVWASDEIPWDETWANHTDVFVVETDEDSPGFSVRKRG